MSRLIAAQMPQDTVKIAAGQAAVARANACIAGLSGQSGASSTEIHEPRLSSFCRARPNCPLCLDWRFRPLPFGGQTSALKLLNVRSTSSAHALRRSRTTCPAVRRAIVIDLPRRKLGIALNSSSRTCCPIQIRASAGDVARNGRRRSPHGGAASSAHGLRWRISLQAAQRCAFRRTQIAAHDRPNERVGAAERRAAARKVAAT